LWVIGDIEFFITEILKCAVAEKSRVVRVEVQKTFLRNLPRLTTLADTKPWSQDLGAHLVPPRSPVRPRAQDLRVHMVPPRRSCLVGVEVQEVLLRDDLRLI
jgi:hypothetical protein